MARLGRWKISSFPRPIRTVRYLVNGWLLLFAIGEKGLYRHDAALP